MDSANNVMFHELLRVLNLYRNLPHVEIEMRMGWKHQTGQPFDTNIGEAYLSHIMSNLNGSPVLDIVADTVTHVYTHQNTRIITDSHDNVISSHKKRKIEMIDFLVPGTPFDIRLSICVEQPVPMKSKPIDSVFVRKRVRTAYRYKLWSYEATHCTAQTPFNKYTTDIESYEMELELDIVNSAGSSSTYLANSTVMKIWDLIRLNKCEKIDLKSISLCDKKVYTNHTKLKPRCLTPTTL